MDMISDTVYFIWSMKRSGAHGFEQWLFPNINGRYLFFNNKKVSNPSSGSPANFCDSFNGRQERWDSLVFGFEDYEFPICEGGIRSTEDVIESITGKNRVGNVINVIVLRDPLNLISSRMKTREKDKRMDVDESTVSLWVNNAMEFLGETSFLSNKMAVNFNTWFSDEGYRKRLAESFCLEFNDSGKNKVGMKGSSFDGKAYKGRASQMDVLCRWRDYQDNDEFVRLVSDDRVMELSSKIYGDSYVEIIERLKK